MRDDTIAPKPNRNCGDLVFSSRPEVEVIDAAMAYRTGGSTAKLFALQPQFG